MTTRNYSANAVASALSAGVNDTTTTIPVTVTTGFPAAPFIIALDYGAAEQELALVTAVAGLNLTATRGYDSTTAQAHSLGAVVRHVHSAIDFRDSRTHEAATSGVHGVTGSFVGTTDTQALTNKDLSSGTNTFPATHVTTSGTQTLTNKTLTLGSNTVSGTKAQFNTALTDGDFATLAGTETLTGKTIDLTDNTVTGTIAELNTAVSDADLATLAGTETLTNKTINLSNNTLAATLAQVNAAVSDTNLASVDGTETLSNKTLASPAVTGTLAGAAATFSGNVAATGAVTGSNLPTAIKAGTTGPLAFDSNGFASITHNLGTTPVYFAAAHDVALAGGIIVLGVRVSSLTSTTAAVWAMNADGTKYTGSLTTIRWIAVA